MQPADHEGCPQWCHPMEDKRDISELGFQWVFSSLNPRKETTNTSTVSLHLSELMLWHARVNFTSAIAGSDLNLTNVTWSDQFRWFEATNQGLTQTFAKNVALQSIGQQTCIDKIRSNQINERTIPSLTRSCGYVELRGGYFGYYPY